MTATEVISADGGAPTGPVPAGVSTAPAPAQLPDAPVPVGDPAARAALAGLHPRACLHWPAGEQPPAVAGFIVSSFSPLAAEVARRCLAAAAPIDPALAERTAVVLVSAFGDVVSAVHVADAVDAGRRIGPLMFFQSVPNAVAGHIAAQAGLAGPVTCISAATDPVGAGLDLAGLLIMDGDADAVLLVVVEQAGPTGTGVDRALAMFVSKEQATEGDPP